MLFHLKIKNTIKKSFSEIITNDPLQGNKIYSSKIIKENNISYDNTYLAEDLGFFIKNIVHSKKIVTISDIVLNYRILSTSLSRTNFVKIFDVFRSLDNIEKYIIDNHADFINKKN